MARVDCMLDRLLEPTVFHAMIDKWSASQWTPEELGKIFKDKLLKFRIGRKKISGVQWETDCCYQVATMDDFLCWTHGNTDAKNPFDPFPVDDHWCYMDYKYMAEIFEDQQEMLNSVDWSVFGFEGRGGKDSTMWVGSEGANTVCHMDTYGCNLVAQIHGRKRWILFPPSDSAHLYPTRIPYEESSVFSRVNVLAPDLSEHPLFAGSHPRVVELQPGDVLFVPSHWWHHVESIDPITISVNSWIEMESDKAERISEAVTRTLCFLTMSGASPTWMNPTEEETDLDTNLEYIEMSVGAAADFSNKSGNLKNGDKEKPTCDSEPPVKKAKLFDENFVQKHVCPISEIDFADYLTRDFINEVTKASSSASKEGISREDFIRCVTHPDTVAVIVEKLKQQMNARF